MPAARAKPAKPAFKEPPALARLAKSIETAEAALTQLRAGASPGFSRTARELQRDVRKFLTAARRDTRKLGLVLKRDFEATQKAAAASGNGSNSRRPAAPQPTGTAKPAPAKRAAAKRAAAKPAAAKHTAAKPAPAKSAAAKPATATSKPAKRATAKRTTAKRSPAGRTTAKNTTRG